MPRLVVVRCLGLFAAVLLAVVAVLGGALPHGYLASTPVTIARGPHGAVILCGWSVGTGLLAYAWWAVRDRIPSARWALGTALLWAAPFLVVPPVGSRDLYSYACQGYLYAHGVSPYEAGVSTLPCPWIDAVSPIWRETAAPYGPLFVLLAGWVVRLSGDSLIAVVLLFRLLAVAGLAAVALGLPVLARRCGIPAGRALWIGLAGPLVGAHLVGGPHNDALMIGLIVAGLAVATRAASLCAAETRPSRTMLPLVSRATLPWGSLAAPPFVDRATLPFVSRSVRSVFRPAVLPLVAGVLLGLAVAVKVVAVVVVPFAILLVCARPYRWRQALHGGGLLVGGAVAAMGGVTAASGLGLGWIAGLVNTRDLVQFTSPPTAVGMALTYLGKPISAGFDAVPAVRLVAGLLLVTMIAVLLWRAATSEFRRSEPSDFRPGATSRFWPGATSEFRWGAAAGAGLRTVPAGAGAGVTASRGVRGGDSAVVALRGAALAMAATVGLSPYFHPWYAAWALVLLAATTLRTGLIMAAATAGPLLVLPDGGGLARFVKFPGAPLMTLFLVVLLVRFLRGRLATQAVPSEPAGGSVIRAATAPVRRTTPARPVS